MTESYKFWGLVQSAGEVSPANKDYSIYYSESSVQNNLEGLIGTEIILSHLRNEVGGVEEYKIGEVRDFAILQDNLFVLNEIDKQLYDEFRNTLEEENKYIGLSFNQLTEEIDAGNLALSAGLTDVATTPTPVHDKTVVQYNWKEVSIVPSPASPGAWAWECDDQCQTIFSDSMSEQEPQLDPSEDEENNVEQEEVHNEPQTPDVVQMGDEEYKLVPVDEIEQEDCSCNTEELKQELQAVKDENEKLNKLVDEFKQQRREEAKEDIKQINQGLPEGKAYSEEELEQMFENDSAQELRQTADLMERLAPEKEEISQGEEDLSGSGSEPDQLEEQKEQVNQVSRELFGKDFETMMKEIEEEQAGGK